MHPILTGLSKARGFAASLPARFLVAEDDHELRFIIVHVLSQTFPSARIAAFANGKDALDDFDQNGAFRDDVPQVLAQFKNSLRKGTFSKASPPEAAKTGAPASGGR